MSEESTIVKIVKELHETQAERIKLTTQLEFMTIMCNSMADELAKIENVGSSKIMEEYTYSSYEKIKSKEK